MNSPQKVATWWRWWFVGYVALFAVVVSTMFWARQSALANSSSLTSQSDWQAWRDDVTKNDKAGPVERRIPSSKEPPALVLMRDKFAVMLFGAILFSSVLYWIMAWFINGMLKSQ